MKKEREVRDLPPPLAPLSMLSAGLPRRILELSTITSSDTYSRHHIWREGRGGEGRGG